MRAVIFTGAGGPDQVAMREVADPVPGRGEVLVRVRAAGVNRADLLQRRGLYPPPPGVREDIPGLELAGEVVQPGEGVTSWKPGDRVMAIAAGEAQAELAVVHERMLMPIPERLSFEDAGAVPEAFITAHDALFTNGDLRLGWTVLVHAAGSGVSTAAIQLVKAAGARAVGTSRTRQKLDLACDLGMDRAILITKDEPWFADDVKRATGGHGVDLILDTVGAPYAAENLAALAQGGRIIVVGLLGGSQAAIDLGLLMRLRAAIVGTVLRSRSLEDKIQATRDFARDVLPLLVSGRVRPVLNEVLPMERAREAHERLEKNDVFGKLVLVPQ